MFLVGFPNSLPDLEHRRRMYYQIRPRTNLPSVSVQSRQRRIVLDPGSLASTSVNLGLASLQSCPIHRSSYPVNQLLSLVQSNTELTMLNPIPLYPETIFERILEAAATLILSLFRSSCNRQFIPRYVSLFVSWRISHGRRGTKLTSIDNQQHLQPWYREDKG
jgi:hypothetical protein